VTPPAPSRPVRVHTSLVEGRCEFDVRQIPFSVQGSWLNLSPVVGLHTVADQIHLVSHVNGMHAVIRLRAERDGEPVPVQWRACPTALEWWAEDGSLVSAVFEGPRRLRLRGDGLALRLVEAAGELTPFTGGYLFRDPVDDAAVFTSYETGRRYRVQMLEGELSTRASEGLGRTERSVVLGEADHPWEAVVVETTSGAEPGHVPLADVVGDREASFEAFADALVPARARRAPTATLAAYTLWSATVDPEGMLARTSVLMSKHWMDKVWSWDHCFNALALAPAFPDLALDQFLVPFDHQDETGALPDSVAHSEVLYNYVKPPVHGWAFGMLRDSAARELTRAELELVHDRLSRWSDFWLTQRRAPGHALPYYQHGNDSGWDNSTAFDLDRVVESPDLAAFLVVQLDVLAGLSRELGHADGRWAQEADRLTQALLTQLWTPDGFVALGALTGRPSSTSSLLTLMPLMLGDRLPADIRQVMVEKVRLHLTEHGLATELPTSPHYQADGYWRGPVWAPATALVVAGLRQSGEGSLADEICRRFAALCERSGFAENFDALSGDGLRDRAYTWTAAVYLTLTGS
jgi:glycogen debranching enzyme